MEPRVADWPLHPKSKDIIDSIGADKPLRYNPDMGFVLVPPDQKKIDVKLVELSGRVGQGPYPLPDNVPIEGWPANYTGTSRSATRSSRASRSTTFSATSSTRTATGTASSSIRPTGCSTSSTS